MCVGRPTRCFAKPWSTRLAVKLVHISDLALATEAGAGIVVPLLASVAADPLLAIANFDGGIRRVAGGTDELRLFGRPCLCRMTERVSRRRNREGGMEGDRLGARSPRKEGVAGRSQQRVGEGAAPWARVALGDWFVQSRKGSTGWRSNTDVVCG